MSLREYVRKRKFDETPEPAPDVLDPHVPSSGRFYIQRHDATRLHYDFRLEIAGTLKSWAVPKGVSLVPLQKNLAMHVEDHPLDYGEFEGNIPAGNYGAGSVMLWDKGTFEQLGKGSGEEQIERGDLKFRLHGSKVRGEFALVRMKGRGKGNEWLLIKKRDEFADEAWDVEEHAFSVKTGRTQEEIARDLPPTNKAPAAKGGQKKSSPPLKGAKKAPMPHMVTPMMAQPSSSPPAGKGWIYEIKWDGVRAICHIEGGHVRMYSRNGNSYDRQFPELAVLPHQVQCDTAIFDGEIVVVDEKGKSSFELIQPRIHQTDPNTIAHLVRRTPVRLFLFDLLYLDGYDLRGVPIEERKELLKNVVSPGQGVFVSDHFDVSGEEMLAAARQMNLEGIMAKRRGSLYEDRRSDCWLKVKITTTQEFVICGFTHGERDTFSSLVLGVCDSGEFLWAGNVGTGFDDKTLRDLYRRLQPLITTKNTFRSKPAMLRSATWVEPVLVCECKYTEWTREGRLRAPVFLGLRADKEPTECVREQPEARPATPSPAEAPAPKKAAKKAKAAKSAKTGSLTRDPLFPPTAKELATEVDGKRIKFTNLGKIWYPEERITKRDVLNYYDAVSDLILPHLRDRPLSLKRYPNGIYQDFFFQKNIPDTYPDWLRTVPIPSEHRGEDINFVVADDRATLLYLTNLGCIDQNPWMSRIASLENPDYVLIDLDPVECGYGKIVDAALLVRDVLDEIGLKGYPKTTGGDGMHVIVPMEPRYSYDQARSFAEIVSQLVIARKPDLFTTPRSVDKRKKNRVYFDYMQLAFSKTISAPYVVRAYDGAPVATPLDWSEVQAGLTPGQFHIGNAVERFRERGDLFAGVLTDLQELEPALERIARLVDK